MTQHLDVERLMLKAGHMLPPGSVLKPAERSAIEDLVRVVRAEALEDAAKVAESFVWFDEENCSPDEGNVFIAKKLRALAEGVRT